MKFGWINIFGIVIVVIMLIPNIIYAVKKKKIENKYQNTLINLLEQIGRYFSLFFMIFSIGGNGFNNVSYMIVYLIGNVILLPTYIIIWILYFKNRSLYKVLFLAIIPTIIFLICGITLGNWGLLVSSIIFGFSHILITYKNNC